MEKDLLALTCGNTKPGEFITFGKYPQTADGIEQEIVWRVLQNSGNELFVLSESILDCKRYHGQSTELKWRDCTETTWHDCDLREWLNHEFYDAAFHAAEKRLIKTTYCTGNGEGCPDTGDKVFLLSVDEVKVLTEIHGKGLLRAVGTGFAKTKKPDGCSLYVYDKSNKDNYIMQDGEELGCSWWWLRTQGNKPTRACFVGTGGSIRSYGNNSIGGYGVRPALRIHLSW